MRTFSLYLFLGALVLSAGGCAGSASQSERAHMRVTYTDANGQLHDTIIDTAIPTDAAPGEILAKAGEELRNPALARAMTEDDTVAVHPWQDDDQRQLAKKKEDPCSVRDCGTRSAGDPGCDPSNTDPNRCSGTQSCCVCVECPAGMAEIGPDQR